MALTPKQSRFVEEYLIDLNATQAAIRAGYSEKTAHTIGHENLIKPYIAAAIQEAQDSRSRRTEVTQDRVLLELARLAFSDLRQFTGWGPHGIQMKDSEELGDHDAACVQEVSLHRTGSGYTMKFKLHDKTPAIKMLGQHLGMFSDKVDLTVTDPEKVLAKILGIEPDAIPE